MGDHWIRFCSQRAARRVVWGVVVLVAGSAAAFAQGRAPVPDDAALTAARALLREVYGKEYDRAETPAEKAALAKKLLAQAATAKGDPGACFVLLQLARDASTQAGDYETAMEAIDQMAGAYDVDGLKMKLECLQAVSKAVRASQSKVVAQQAASLVNEAVADDDYETARGFGELAQALARRARDYGLVRQIVAQMKQVEESEKAYAESKRALAVLEETPTDPQANHTAGRYLCLVKGDWERGIPMLALGSDAALKALASKELEGAPSPSAQLALGDDWWDLAEQTNGEAKKALLERASFWYRKAHPKLTQLLKLKVDKRLEAIEEASKGGAEKDEGTTGRMRRATRRAREDEVRGFPGRWMIKYTNKAVRVYLIDGNGNVAFLGENRQGRLRRWGEDILLDFGDGRLERLRLVDGTLRVEHFSPADSYPHRVTLTGVGTRME